MQDIEDPAWLCLLSWSCCRVWVVELGQGTAETLSITHFGLEICPICFGGGPLEQACVSLYFPGNSRNDKNVF